jgi:hypothetical protein
MRRRPSFFSGKGFLVCRAVALAVFAWIIVVGIQGCSDGRTLFYPKPPLEKIPPSQPKFIPSDHR